MIYSLLGIFSLMFIKDIKILLESKLGIYLSINPIIWTICSALQGNLFCLLSLLILSVFAVYIYSSCVFRIVSYDQAYLKFLE